MSDKKERKLTFKERIQLRKEQQAAEREHKEKIKLRREAEAAYEEKLSSEGRTGRRRSELYSQHHLWGNRLWIANLVVLLLFLLVLALVVFY